MAESFYQAGDVPPAITQAQDGDLVYTLGTALSHAVGGTITHIRWYGADSPDATVPVALYVGGLLVGSGTEASPVSGWQETALTVPVEVDPDVVFIPAVAVNRYVATGSFFGSEQVRGDFTAPASAGRLSTAGSPPQLPDTPTASAFFVDVVLEPSSVAAAEGVADVGLGLAVAATGRRTSAGAAALGVALGVAAVGRAPARGTVALGLGLAVAAVGSDGESSTVVRPNAGTVTRPYVGIVSRP